MLDGVLPELFLVAVFLKTGSDKTKLERNVRSRPTRLHVENHLSTPVPKVVHRGDIPSVGLVEVCEVGSDDGRSKVTDVEVLGNVGGRILNDDFLPLPRIIASVFGLASGRVLGQVMNLSQDLLIQRRGPTSEVKESLFLSNRLDPFIWFELERTGITE